MGLPGFLAVAATTAEVAVATIAAATTAAAQEEQDQDNEHKVPAAIASTKHVWHLLSGSLHSYHMTAAGMGAHYLIRKHRQGGTYGAYHRAPRGIRQ